MIVLFVLRRRKKSNILLTIATKPISLITPSEMKTVTNPSIAWAIAICIVLL